MGVQARRERPGTASRHHTMKAQGRRLATQCSGRGKRSRAHVRIRYRGPKISRTRVQFLRDDLDSTRMLVADTVRRFWVIPDGEIREMLAKTNANISKAIEMLKKAA